MSNNISCQTFHSYSLGRLWEFSTCILKVKITADQILPRMPLKQIGRTIPHSARDCLAVHLFRTEEWWMLVMTCVRLRCALIVPTRAVCPGMVDFLSSSRLYCSSSKRAIFSFEKRKSGGKLAPQYRQWPTLLFNTAWLQAGHLYFTIRSSITKAYRAKLTHAKRVRRATSYKKLPFVNLSFVSNDFGIKNSSKLR